MIAQYLYDCFIYAVYALGTLVMMGCIVAVALGAWVGAFGYITTSKPNKRNRRN